jgi:hypothetical protein
MTLRPGLPHGNQRHVTLTDNLPDSIECFHPPRGRLEKAGTYRRLVTTTPLPPFTRQLPSYMSAGAPCLGT